MQTIKVGNFNIDVMHKEIKNVHLSVYPPTGRVTISAPSHMNTELLRVYAISRIGWIKQQQKKLLSQVREPVKEFVNRETHYFKGKRYLLKLENNQPTNTVELKHNKLIDTFYRVELHIIIPKLITKWSTILNVNITAYGIKKMRTKWGTCNTIAKRIWVNVELAKKPIYCIEYIIVHELVHLLERKHNYKFEAHLNRHLPNWKQIKQELNELPVGV